MVVLHTCWLEHSVSVPRLHEVEL